MDKKIFSEWLLEQMGNQNLTQADLAKASGLTCTAISDYINQKRTNPEPRALIALAKALHVSLLIYLELRAFYQTTICLKTIDS